MEKTIPYVVSINENAARYLYKSANWTTFFAILGFIMAGLLTLACLGLILGAGVMSRMGGPALANMPFSIAWFGIIYLPFAVLYIWVSALMLGFASKAKQALKHNDDELIEQSFKKMNRFLTIMGIMTIVGLVFYFVILIGAIVSSLTGITGAMV